MYILRLLPARMRIDHKSAMLWWSPYILAKFCEVGSTHPWESSVSSDPPSPKIARKNALNFDNNSAADYSISLKFCTEFKRMTSEML